MEETSTNKDLNDQTSTSSSTRHSINVIENPKPISHECKICGVPALHSNYGAITCPPCKIFFKRNVVIDSKQLKCKFNSQCEININTRHTCSSCRLAKCFASGMQADLIRCPLSKKTSVNQNSISITTTSNILMTTTEQNQLQLLPTTSLLQSDNSTLTIDQWTLLSNLIYSYDESKLLLIAQQFINESNNLQSSSTTNDLILAKEFFIKIYETAGKYVRSNGDFYTLSSDDRSAFLHNIAENVTCLGAILCWNRSQIYNCESFIKICIEIYGEDSINLAKRVSKFIDSDIIIAKLALSLFAFSNIKSGFYSNTIMIKPLNTLSIFDIQNIYAEVIWKYLLYKYGYSQSIQRFINLIQCLLAATNTVFDAQNIEKHVNDVESLVEETELALILDDIEYIDENNN